MNMLYLHRACCGVHCGWIETGDRVTDRHLCDCITTPQIADSENYSRWNMIANVFLHQSFVFYFCETDLGRKPPAMQMTLNMTLKRQMWNTDLSPTLSTALPGRGQNVMLLCLEMNMKITSFSCGCRSQSPAPVSDPDFSTGGKLGGRLPKGEEHYLLNWLICCG